MCYNPYFFQDFIFWNTAVFVAFDAVEIRQIQKGLDSDTTKNKRNLLTLIIRYGGAIIYKKIARL